MAYVSKATSYGWPESPMPRRPIEWRPSGAGGFGSYVESGTQNAGVTGAVTQAMSTFTGLSNAIKIGVLALGVYLLATKTKFGKRVVGGIK